MDLNPHIEFDTLDLFSQKSMIDTDIASVEDYQVCRKIMHAASKNYSFASLFLPKGKLRHVEALYALMRVGDDRVDVSHKGFDTPQAAIGEWEQLYWTAFERGDSAHPVMRAYLQTALECGIPRETMAPYFRAMCDDLSITRFPTFSDLLHYMDGSAIPVGRAMTHILGVRPPFRISDALPGADNLSIAMQLSNFWRDIVYDWSLGRIYIPQEDLERFRLTETDLELRRITPEFIDLLEYEFSRTEAYYSRARSSVTMLASGRWAVMGGLEIYRSIISGIRRNRYNVFSHRAETSKTRKLYLAIKSLWYL